MVKRKKERMDDAELQDEIEAELEEVPQIQVAPEESEEVPPPLSVPETGFDRVVDQVLRGEWGSGQDRRRRLSEAGISHVAVQKEIVRRMNTK